MYSILFANSRVHKSCERLPSVIHAGMEEAFSGLEKDPRPSGSKMLSGRLNRVWRIRVGDYRILYEINDSNRKVIILDVGHRREIYR